MAKIIAALAAAKEIINAIKELWGLVTKIRAQILHKKQQKALKAIDEARKNRDAKSVSSNFNKL